MAPHLLLVLRILFFLTGVSDTQSVSTVSHVSVKQGGSITIPCLYNQRYRNNVKYGCRGYNWFGCSTVVRTDHPKTSGKTSVSDDINQRVFTVTMTSLSLSDSDYYWCIVERKSKADDGDRLQISVTPGTPELYVDQQQITGVVGGSVTVLCYYSSQGSSGRWCRMGGSCVAVGYYGALDGTFVKLVQEQRETTNGYVLMVNMSGLMMKNTGWYWCEKGKLQMPVRITVNQPTTTQSTTANQNNGGTDETQQEKDQRLERMFFYLLKAGSVLPFLLCTIIAVVKFRENRHQDDTKDALTPESCFWRNLPTVCTKYFFPERNNNTLSVQNIMKESLQ
ncbi:polymeric immunoglobulin receptor-like isoform X7 [Oncorhynchus mykiss]|uniref:polymeric immunoglobulin receptor-like isoform X7 n=1 Tax=Oncorhynchus mykiss TaxID=8022 RepID=UPI0018789669|nr:polymeric immunoglobulin receptor-like isoform X7 [Oncorhynchus mykiss]